MNSILITIETNYFPLDTHKTYPIISSHFNRNTN